MKNIESKFDGKLIEIVGINILNFFIITCTLGICYPWAICRKYRWEINHKIINGKRLNFGGKGIELFGLWIRWLGLSIITFGIYGFWIPVSLNKWLTKHTNFES
jgi:uncharacterized membrane protein YjgN (DUF898 family)